jgi:hypothetical protein
MPSELAKRFAAYISDDLPPEVRMPDSLELGNALLAAEQLLDGVAAFFRGQDDSQGLPDGFEKLADYEPVDVTFNARTIRAVLAATEPPSDSSSL